MVKPRVVRGDIAEDLAGEFFSGRDVAVDCEMMGLNPYRDRLCLVQLRVEGGPSLIIQVDEEKEAPRLKELMESESINKIFHFARMDMLFLRIRLGIRTKNVFCTKLSSRLARTYTDRHGLRDLVREFTGDTLDKSNQSSDWGKEKLSDDQIYYAENDVKYLFKLKSELSAILEREGRMELARQANAFLPVRLEMDRLGYGDVFEF